jgi:hypothetical protein
MPPHLNYRRFVRNVAVVGGAAAALDFASGYIGVYELILQTVVTLGAGVYGLFRRDDDDSDDTGLAA